ncbi:Calcium homeostasis endoplasmic reticulum protein, partial [Lachnellula subtilissima]
MASHQLAIAKASFSAGLLRPDPTSLSREDIAHFHALLNSAVLQCTPRNVQKCKQWILENIIQSSARFTALGKYLTALSTSFTDSEKHEPSVKRKRLHLLYLINDILYHTKYRVSDASICSKAQPILVNLFGSAASFKDCPKHQQKLLGLLEIWEEKGYYSGEYVDKLRETVKNASEAGEHLQGNGSTSDGDNASTAKLAKSAPYVMPAMHGDTSTPWFDLPAGNLLQHIEPNSTKPINPDMIKPMQFIAGPANEERRSDYIRTENQEDRKADLDIDDLGQSIILDEISGDVIDGEGYYGWSRGFCERMKQKKKGFGGPERRDRSRSRSSSPGRKRGYSDSDGSGSEDYRPSQRRRSYSPSRSPTPEHRRNDHSGPLSRSHSRTSSPARDSYSREPRPLSTLREGLLLKPPMPMPPPYQQQGFNPNFPPPPPLSFNGPGPTPYGQWPPPPPPLGPPPM